MAEISNRVCHLVRAQLAIDHVIACYFKRLRHLYNLEFRDSSLPSLYTEVIGRKGVFERPLPLSRPLRERAGERVRRPSVIDSPPVPVQARPQGRFILCR